MVCVCVQLKKGGVYLSKIKKGRGPSDREGGGGGGIERVRTG